MKRSFYKRGNGRILHIPAALLDGMDVDAVSVERVAGGLMVRPIRGNVLMTIAGIDCFTWEDVAWVGKCMHENGYVPDGWGGALAGVMPTASAAPGGENGGDAAAGEPPGDSSTLF